MAGAPFRGIRGNCNAFLRKKHAFFSHGVLQKNTPPEYGISLEKEGKSRKKLLRNVKKALPKASKPGFSRMPPENVAQKHDFRQKDCFRSLAFEKRKSKSLVPRGEG